MTCAACANSSVEPTPVLVRSLPPVPSYVAPVKAPEPTVGADPKVFAGQALVALDKANGRLVSARARYEGVAQDYSAATGGLRR